LEPLAFASRASRIQSMRPSTYLNTRSCGFHSSLSMQTSNITEWLRAKMWLMLIATSMSTWKASVMSLLFSWQGKVEWTCKNSFSGFSVGFQGPCTHSFGLLSSA
jgi:hypothetical protein